MAEKKRKKENVLCNFNFNIIRLLYYTLRFTVQMNVFINELRSK